MINKINILSMIIEWKLIYFMLQKPSIKSIFLKNCKKKIIDFLNSQSQIIKN